jgi:hypothetical protein
MNSKFIPASAALLLLGYLALSGMGIRAGISSLDAWGIMEVAGDRIHTGTFGQSRPPGHPLNEDWMLPAFAGLAGGTDGQSVISPMVYGIYQLTGGLVCVAVFWFFLGECRLPSGRRLLALACFVFSPLFLIESMDGEEFLWATACIMGALVLVGKLAAGNLRRPVPIWIAALALAAACTGYRLEIGAMALGAVVTTLLVSDRTFAQKLGLGLVPIIVLGLLWGPLLLQHGANPPYAIPLDLKVRIEVGLYKIIFGLLGAIPMALAAFFFWDGRADLWRRIFPPFDRGTLNYWLPRLAVLFFLLFFCYPTKPIVMLPGLGFLIAWGALRARPWVWACFVAACISIQLVHLDCFENRAWVGLKAERSLWSQFYAKKPLFRGPAIAFATAEAEGGRRVVIANDFPWDFAWNLQHGKWTAAVQPQDRFNHWIQSYRVGPGIVGSRMMLDQTDLLGKYVAQGYEIWVDEGLYREVYQRYSLASANGGTVVIDDVPCRLVKMSR